MGDLNKLAKLLKQSLGRVRVGVLGENAARSDGELNNAQIGSWHEFGTSQLPVRSFLRVPLQTRFRKAMDASGAFDKASLREVLRQGSFVPWLKKAGIVAEGVVLEAFDTGGFSKWPVSDMANKTNHQTLVETGQLRNSITSEVVDRK